jgi:hypothetical protein
MARILKMSLTGLNQNIRSQMPENHAVNVYGQNSPTLFQTACMHGISFSVVK